MVVSGGKVIRAISTSSNPTMEMSSGTRAPPSRSPVMTAAAYWSPLTQTPVIAR